MQIIKYIPLRRSTRRFSEKPLSGDIINNALSAVKDFLPLDEKQEIRFLYTHKDNIPAKAFKEAFGDFGKLYNAQHYFAIAVSQHIKTKNTLAGFAGQQFILHLTSEGISTCWMSSFNTPVFRKLFDVKEGETVPAIISAGYPGEDFQGKLINKMMGKTSGKRKKLKNIIYRDNVKTRADEKFLKDKDLLHVFEMARLAPSWHNIQPWYFIVCDNCIYLVWDTFQRRYKKDVLEMRKHFYTIDMGIIMSHISLTLQDEGKKGKWEILSEKKADKIKLDLGIKETQGVPYACLTLETENG